MPSRFTLVPGSQGPRHSGSVARATSQVFTPTERVRTMICSQGDEMSLLTTGTRRCKGNTAGVETGDSICGEGETCRSPSGTEEGEQVSTGIYIPGEPQAQGWHLLNACASRRFNSHTLSEDKALIGLSHPGVPIPM